MESKRLDSAALTAGISPNYINTHDKPQSISAETKWRLLDAVYQRTTAKAATMPIPNVMVYTSGKKMPTVVEGSDEYNQLLTTGEGTQYEGHVTGGEAFNLPTELPEGYHTLVLTQNDQRVHCRVTAASGHYYEPQALLDKQKLWDACAQLYTLRSEKNQDIGDFGDLRAILEDVAKRGGSFISPNPIHALYPANLESTSPHGPSPHRWLDVIYIGTNVVEDFHFSEETQA